MAKKSKPTKKAKASSLSKKKAKPAKKAGKSKPKAAKKTVKNAKPVKKEIVKKAVKKSVKKSRKLSGAKVKLIKPVAKKVEAKAVKTKAIKEVVVAKTSPVALTPAPKGRPGKPKKEKVKKIKKVFAPFNPIQISAEKAITKKEPKGKFVMEFVMRCSEALLYDFFTAPSGLSEWFADNVNIRDGLYTFFWEGSKQEANLIALKEDQHARYQWVDKTDGSYFEFRIQTDDLTGDVSFLITDFAETKDDEVSARLLWETQVEKLKKTIGSFVN